jgi:hypothetical protein
LFKNTWFFVQLAHPLKLGDVTILQFHVILTSDTNIFSLDRQGHFLTISHRVENVFHG